MILTFSKNVGFLKLLHFPESHIRFSFNTFFSNPSFSLRRHDGLLHYSINAHLHQVDKRLAFHSFIR